MKPVEIILTFRKSDFEEIYFRNGNEKLYFSPIVKNRTYLFILTSFTFFCFLIHFILTNEYQEIVALLFILWLMTTIAFFSSIYIVLKWRKSIKTFLEKTSKYKINKVVLSENGLFVIQDDEETFEKWSEFNTVNINTESIEMHSKINYLFPSKSMNVEDYQSFKKIVSEKIKNGL